MPPTKDGNELQLAIQCCSGYLHGPVPQGINATPTASHPQPLQGSSGGGPLHSPLHPLHPVSKPRAFTLLVLQQPSLTKRPETGVPPWMSGARRSEEALPRVWEPE